MRVEDLLPASSWTCESCSSNDGDLEVLAVDLDEEVFTFFGSSASASGVLLPIEHERWELRSSSTPSAPVVLDSVRWEINLSSSRL